MNSSYRQAQITAASQKQREGFVEISEQDTPFFKFMEAQKNSLDCGKEAENEQERAVEAGMLVASLNLRKELEKMRKESNVAARYNLSEGSSYTYNHSASESLDLPAAIPRKTKNSIFDMDFSIAKPITQMTEKELLDYKGSIGIDCGPRLGGVGIAGQPTSQSTSSSRPCESASINSATTESKAISDFADGRNGSIVVPVKLQFIEPQSIQQARQHHTQLQQQQPSMHESLDSSSQPNTPFKSENSAFRPSFLRHESHIPTSSLDFSTTTTTLLEKEPLVPHIATISKKQSPFYSHPIYLSYLPISKNFLGEGQFSNVYRGSYNTSLTPSLQIPCAIKASHKGEDSFANALQEVVILYHLGILGTWNGGSVNPHVIRLIDVKLEEELSDSGVYQDILQKFSDGGGSISWPPTDPPEKIPRLLLVLEYCQHGDMDSWLSRNPRVLGARLFLKWAEQIALGIAALHSAGIIHHDIKPHNIMLTEVYDVRIGDFGSAKFVPLVDQFFTSNATCTTSWWKNTYNTNTLPPNETVSNASFQFPLITPEKSGSIDRNPLHSLDVSISLGRGTISYSAPELLVKPSTTPLSTTTTPSFPLPPLPSSYSFPVDMYAYGATLYTLISATAPFSNTRSTTQLILTKTLHGFFAEGAQSLVSKWKHPDPTDFQWQFPDSSNCPGPVCSLVQRLVQNEQGTRPTALEVSRIVARMIE